MKNCFSNCFPLLYICLHCGEVCICWHFGAPGTPGFYVGAQHDPEKNEIYFIFFILTQKVLIRLLLYLTCKLLLNRGYMWTKMGPVWLFKKCSSRVWKTGKTGKKIMVREKSGNFILGQKSGKSFKFCFKLPWKLAVTFILVDYRECLSRYSPIWKCTCEL